MFKIKDGIKIGGDVFANSSLNVYGSLYYDNDNTGYFLNPSDTTTSLTVAGNVGIGTTSPSGLLHLAKGTRDLKFLLETTPASGDVGVQLRGGSGDYIGIASDTGTGIVVDSNNNVGIGTSSPDTILEVRGSSPILTIRDSQTSSLSAQATLRLAESGASDTLNNYYDITADAGVFKIIDAWNEGAGAGPDTRLAIIDNGNVGIGTDSPSSQKLHVNGEIRSASMLLGDSSVGNVATNSQLHIKTGGTPRIMLEDSTGANLNIGIDAEEGTGFTIRDYGTSPSNTPVNRLRIDTSGNVGINTTSPTYQFSVHNASDVWHAQFGQIGGKQLRLGGRATYGAVIGAYNDNTNNSPASLSLQRDGGNVGIGTDNPAFTDGSGLEIQRSGTATLRLDSQTFGTEIRGKSDGTEIYQLSAGYLDLGTSNTTRVRIDSSGNLLVGTQSSVTIDSSAPLFAGAVPKIDVITGTSSNVDFDDLMVLRHPNIDGTGRNRRVGIALKLSNDGSTGESRKMGAIYAESTSAWANNPSLCFATYNTERMRISYDGNTTFSGNVSIDKGTAGDANLTLRADTDNNDEGDHPSIRFKQDGDLVDWRIGIGRTDTDTTGNGSNSLFITSLAGTTDGLRYSSDGTTSYGIFHDGYHPNADKWTTARTNTVTLTGDVTGSGSASVDGTGNWTVSLSTAVGNDTHEHTRLKTDDNRTIAPSEYGAGYLNFGFTSWANNNTAPYADFLHMRSYTDQTGGSDNLVMFKKSGIGMRIWQQGWGSSTAYGNKLTLEQASGNYGSIKVDDDRGVAWAGYAIRDDWVLMSDGATNCGIYNDTDNEWMTRWYRNAQTELMYNGSERLRTTNSGISVNGDIHQSEVHRPNAVWGASTSSTGCVLIRLPGTSSQYDMCTIEIDVYEYNSGAGSKIYVSGHNWTSGWANSHVQVTGGLAKPVYLARDASYYYIQIGDTNSTWTYGSVHVTKVTTASYYSTVDWTSGWNISQATSEPSYAQKSGNFNTTTSNTLRTNGIVKSSGVKIGSEVVLQESTDRADLLQITSSTSGWGGLQIRNSSNEGRWSFMTDGEKAGIYNDEDNTWQLYMHEDGRNAFGSSTVTAGYRLDVHGSMHMHNGSIDYCSQLHFNDNVRFYDDGNDNYLNFKYGDGGAGGIKVLDGNSTLQGYLYADGNDTSSFGLLDGTGSWAVRCLENQYVELRYDNVSKLQTRSDGVEVTGTLYATDKSFLIDHPTKEGYKLRHGVVEGPEHSVYVRGRLNGENVIELPEYWTGLVHEDSITVQLTAIGSSQQLYIEDIKDNKVYVGGADNINCFYYVQATRKDIEQFEVEYEAE